MTTGRGILYPLVWLVWISLFRPASALPPPRADSNDTARVEVRDVPYTSSLRVIAFSEKSETIACPIYWAQFKYLIPDGAFVRKGDLIAEFDSDDVTHRVRQQELERQVIQAELDRKLTDIRNSDMKLRDDLEALQGRLAVLQTKLARYRALPDPDEVKIAEGRFRVSELLARAAEKDLEKARARRERGFLSPAELEKYEREWRDKEASLQHDRDVLDYTKLPASSNTVCKTEIEIENVRMEIEKLEHEIRENAEISRIQRTGAEAQKEIIETRLKESREDLEKTRLLAPIAGHVMHLREFKNLYRSGEKMWKGFNFLRIPDEATLAFKGVLPESERPHFQEGDRALLRVVDRPEEPIEARISSIGKLAHDWAEKEEVDWGGTKKAGIMVYDIVLRPDRRPDWLRYGMHATCELIASRTSRGVSVPLAFAKKKDGDYYLAFEGRYTKVKGRKMGAWFVLDDPAYAKRRVDLFGAFPEERRADLAATNTALFHVSGELIPSLTADAQLKDIFRWQKVAWLEDEDKQVQTGDVVARLEDQETNEEIRRSESLLKEAESERRALEEQQALKKKEGAFLLRRESNLLEIARLDLELTTGGRDWTAIMDAQLALRQADIRLQGLQHDIVRIESNRLDMVSAYELARLKRQRDRAELQREAAGIRLARLETGPTPVQQAKAQLAHTEQASKLDDLVKKVETDDFRIARQLARSRQKEAHAKTELEERRKWKENLVLRAPRDGLVQYAKIWNSGVFSKVNVGSSVGDRFVLMKIADVSRMHVRAEIPEKYYTLVHTGATVRVEIPSLSVSALPGTVSDIEFLFENKLGKDAKKGLYSTHEPLGETVFHAKVEIGGEKGLTLKPGTVADIYFPFPK